MVVSDDSAERTSLLHRGSLDLCVLAVLQEEPLHAFGVVQRLAEHEFADVSFGTVYPLVTRLRRLGMVKQHAARGQGGPARNVLSLTPEGRAALRRWTSQSAFSLSCCGVLKWGTSLCAHQARPSSSSREYAPATLHPRAFSAFGYFEALAVADGEIDTPTAIGRDVGRTRAYARRQATWFRSEPGIGWLEAADPGRAATEAARRLLG